MEIIMTDSYNYSLIQNEQGAYAIRSSVKSFNLDHITDKDVVSFYNSFSQFASFDTGLLPLDGTGVLAIRTAGPHTQVVTQHAPGKYHINWGAHEGDRNARTYYVAQPYRIVIGDFENGNLLGARMFYSPYPITSPNNILYHVNLPNINCKGYRGNGVGWICLYHKDDWSKLPFNEKVTRFIERCSGVETYNDANMSETDGPRFYAQNNKPSYITDPVQWESKSEQENYSWTLDPNLWIPVLVQDMDHQDKHYPDGQNLTLAMAMLGNYQAYYSDKNIPKMYNIISRPDLSLTSNNIADFFKKAFASAPVSYVHSEKDDPYSFTVAARDKNGSAQFVQPPLFASSNEDDEDSWICNSCEESFFGDDEHCEDAYGNNVCHSCLTECYIFIEAADAYFYNEDSNLVYSNTDGITYHTEYDTVYSCIECGDYLGYAGKSNNGKIIFSKNHLILPDAITCVCSDCISDYIVENHLSLTQCYTCKCQAIDTVGWESQFPHIKAMLPDSITSELTSQNIVLCTECYSKHYICPCGLLKNQDQQFGPCTPTPMNGETVVSSCCAECLGNVTESPQGEMVAYYQPFNKDYFQTTLIENIHKHTKSVGVKIDPTIEPF